MSDADHQSPIKTPKQLIIVIVAAFVIPVGLILLLVAFITGGKHVDEQGMALKPESIAERIKPVAAVNLRDANAPKVVLSGEQVYQEVCKVCHETGVAGAHKFGDKAAWAPRLSEGLEALTKNAIAGIRAMPPRGGNPDLSDLEIARGIVYMGNAAGAAFKEPAAPVAAAPAPAKDGAPAPAASAALPAKVLFAAGKSALDADGSKAIAAAADYLKANAGAKVNLSGFVDSSGNAAKNAELAKRRAFAVRDALTKAGVAEDRVVLKKPEEIKGGDAAEARRVEISLADTVAVVSASAAPAAPPAAKSDAGKALYDTACQVCHAAGIAGAPKFGDKAAWAPRITTGIEALHASVLKGKGAMPPKGTAMNASDADIKAAVEFMVAAAK